MNVQFTRDLRVGLRRGFNRLKLEIVIIRRWFYEEYVCTTIVNFASRKNRYFHFRAKIK